MSYLTTTFGTNNLKTTGYVFLVIGMITAIYSAVKIVNLGKPTTTDLKLETISTQSMFQYGIIIFMLGLILISSNR